MARLPSLLSLLAFLFLLAGCTHWSQVEARGEMHSVSNLYTIKLPPHWWRYTPDTSPLVLTRDGLALQQISLQNDRVSRRDFEFTERKLASEMLPQEAAEVVLDDLRSSTAISDLDVLENGPTTISGAPGFKLVYTYHTFEGLPKKAVRYGILWKKQFYDLLYTAPARHYFDEHLGDFENMVASMNIRGVE